MKKCMLAMAVALIGLFVAGCGDPNIDTVKKGVLGVDKTRTVEQLLGAKLDDMKWNTFTSDDNRTVVEVIGVWKGSQYRDLIKKWENAAKKVANSRDNGEIFAGSFAAGALTTVAPLLPLDGDTLRLQFIIHADGENFEFCYGEILGEDGKVKENKQLMSRADSTSNYKDGAFLNLFVEEK